MREHAAERQLRAERRTVQVDLDLAACDVVRFVVKRTDPINPRIVDHHSQGPTTLLGPIKERDELVDVADVQSDRGRTIADLCRHCLSGGEIEVPDRHSRSGAREM